MQNLILSFGVVFPLFVMTWLGYFLKKLNMYDDNTLYQMNNVTFRAFLPLLLFYNIYKSDISTSLNPKLMLYGVFCIISAFIFCLIFVPMVEKDNSRKGVLVQAIIRNNFILFGIPIITSLYDESAGGVVSLLVSVIVPLLNVLSVVALEIYRESKINWGKIFKGVVTNPLIIASIIGIIFLVLGIKLPAPVEKTVGDISKIATPLALIILGGSFKFSNIKSTLRPLLIGMCGRLIFMPLIFMSIAIFLGYRGVELAALMTMLATPPAVSSFTMAQQMGGDSDLAGQLVVISTIVSILTLFIWIFSLKQLSFI